MDQAKAQFLFENVPSGVDLDDEDVRSKLLEGNPPVTPAAHAMLEVLANQVAGDRPPETWQTAQRLLEGGLERKAVLAQLLLALSHTIRAAIVQDKPFEAGGFVDLLASLPVPGLQAAGEVLVEAVRRRPGIDGGELIAETVEALGRRPEDPLVVGMLEHLLEDLVDEGLLGYVGDDQVVHVGDLIRGIVLTHRLSEDEIESGILEVGVDMAGFAERDDSSSPAASWSGWTSTKPGTPPGSSPKDGWRRGPQAACWRCAWPRTERCPWRPSRIQEATRSWRRGCGPHTTAKPRLTICRSAPPSGPQRAVCPARLLPRAAPSLA